MKKLRLLTTPECNRKCIGCCNNQFALSALPVHERKDFINYSEVCLSGGEPLLYPDQVEELAIDALAWNPDIKVYLYTAHLQYLDNSKALRVIRAVDGVTLTLHNSTDVRFFKQWCAFFETALRLLDTIYGKKSYRLVVRDNLECKFRKYISERWDIKVITWNPDGVPLPKDEVFKRC